MNKKIVAQNRTVFIGADVHTRKHVVSVKTGREILGTCNLSPNPDAWRSFLKRFPGCELHAIYESGPHGYNLYDWLTGMNGENGQAVHVAIAPPALVPKAPGKRVKTDKRDSKALITAFEMDSFRPVVVPDKQKREERELIRTRNQAKAEDKRLKNQIHGMVKFHGIEYPYGIRWSDKWVQQLAANAKAADTTGNLVFALKLKLKLLGEMKKAVAALDKRIERLYAKGACSEVAQKLTVLTGIGKLSAVIIATEVADFGAFDNSDAFASYVGVVPGEDSSGETTRRGHITRAGNRRLRWIFVECAWIRIRHDPEAKRIYHRIKMGKKDRSRIAIVAVARRLAVKAYHQVVNGEQSGKAAA